MKENQTTPEETTGAGNMIKNPLPGPTPHTKREGVDYDYEVPEDKMHYDLEEITRNYYDI